MSRLTDKDSYCFVTCADDYKGTESIGENCKLYKACFERKMYDKLKHYEDLEEAGRLITLPCNIGDTMWRVVEMSTGKTPTAIKKFVRIVTLTENNAFDISRKFGKTVFLTKAEAEAKLAELKGGGGDE